MDLNLYIQFGVAGAVFFSVTLNFFFLLTWLKGKNMPTKTPKWVSTLQLVTLLWGKAGNEPMSALTSQQKREETNRKRRETTAQKNKKIEIAQQALESPLGAFYYPTDRKA